MKYLSLLLLLIGLVSFQSCKSTKEFSELNEDDIKISLSKGACFGSCPVFTLSIYDGGYAHFYGKRYTTKDGLWLKKLDKKTYTTLITAFEESNFSSFQDLYESEIADLPTVRVSYLTKKVTGKDGRPEEVVRLQMLLEKIANSKEGWKSLDKNKPKATSLESEKVKRATTKPKYNYKEIIIEPKPGHALSRIIAKYKGDYGLRLLGKVAPNQNLWLVTYDKSLVEAKVMIDLLKKENGINNANFNLLISDR